LDRRFFAAEVLFAPIDIDPSRVTPMWLVQNSDATAQNPLPSENTSSFGKLLRRRKYFLVLRLPPSSDIPRLDAEHLIADH
jgi:hypothetical protein